MLLHVGRKIEIDSIKKFFGKDIFDTINPYYTINNNICFSEVNSKRKYLNSIPNKEFNFIYLRPIDAINRYIFRETLDRCKTGVLINTNQILTEINRFFDNLSEIEKNTQLDDIFKNSWNIFSKFDLYKIKDTEYSVFIKKEAPLIYSKENINKLSIKKLISKDDFLILFDKYKNI